MLASANLTTHSQNRGACHRSFVLPVSKEQFRWTQILTLIQELDVFSKALTGCDGRAEIDAIVQHSKEVEVCGTV